MDVDRGPAGGDRVVNPEPPFVIRFTKPFDEEGAGRAHDLPFEPALGGLRVDDHDRRAAALAEPLDEGVAHLRGREILALDVDRLPGAADAPRGSEASTSRTSASPS